jgi:hypothetical protein
MPETPVTPNNSAEAMFCCAIRARCSRPVDGIYAGYPGKSDTLMERKTVNDQITNEAVERFGNAVQRFLDAYLPDIEKPKDGKSWYPDFMQFRDNADAAARYSMHSSISDLAAEFLRKVEARFGSGENFFAHLCDSTVHDGLAVDRRQCRYFAEKLARYGYCRQNADRIRVVAWNIRQQTRDLGKFDREVYEEDAVVRMSAAAFADWNGQGARSMIRKSAEALERRFGVDVGLVSEAHALEHELVQLEQEAAFYESLMNQHRALLKQSKELTGVATE